MLIIYVLQKHSFRELFTGAYAVCILVNMAMNRPFQILMHCWPLAVGKFISTLIDVSNADIDASAVQVVCHAGWQP